MRRILLVLLTTVMFGCNLPHPLHHVEECLDMDAWYIDWGAKPPIRVDATDASRVVLTHAAELQQKYNLRLDNSYLFIDEDSNTINRIRLIYHSMKLYEMCEARALLVDLVEGFIQKVNDDPVVSAQLTNGPFTADDLEVDILLESYYGKFVNAAFVGWIYLEQGMAYYYAFDIYDNRIDTYHSRVEPYYKSLTFVNIDKEIKEKMNANRPPAPQSQWIFQRQL